MDFERIDWGIKIGGGGEGRCLIGASSLKDGKEDLVERDSTIIREKGGDKNGQFSTEGRVSGKVGQVS